LYIFFQLVFVCEIGSESFPFTCLLQWSFCSAVKLFKKQSFKLPFRIQVKREKSVGRHTSHTKSHVWLGPGLPDFSCCNIPKREIYTKKPHNVPSDQKYTKWQQNRPNGFRIYQHLPLQDTPKFTQNVIFGLKICHLATMTGTGEGRLKWLLLCTYVINSPTVRPSDRTRELVVLRNM
jgi:hypothetical protein